MPKRKPPDEKPKKKDQRRNFWLDPAQIDVVAKWAHDEGRSFSAMGKRFMDVGLDLYELWLSRSLIQRIRTLAEEEGRSVGETVVLLVQAGLDARDLQKSRR
jgi:hypothetical protein